MVDQDTDDENVAETRTGGWGTLLHLGFWMLLLAGLWFQWKAAMLVGFFLTIANITGCFIPLIANALVLTVLLPFPPKTTEGVNLCMFVMMGLIVQVWQFSFWIEGAAAH
ncbi:MAG: hypothetical protein ACSHXB_18965 [Sulfitobacter sp.]